MLDPTLFHSTYFANKNLTRDGTGDGKMTIEYLSQILSTVEQHADVVGITIAEYLPFDEEKLHDMFNHLNIFKS